MPPYKSYIILKQILFVTTLVKRGPGVQSVLDHQQPNWSKLMLMFSENYTTVFFSHKPHPRR